MDKQRLSQFADQVFGDMAGTMRAGLAYLGVETGLFKAMAGKGPMTQEAVEQATGLQSRYVKEWLHGMVAAGYLDYDAAAGTFTLPDEHAFLLASEGTDHDTTGLFYAAIAHLAVGPGVAKAFREGGGVGFESYSEEFFAGLDRMTQGLYDHRLCSEWLPAMPSVVEALENGGRALDVGCGTGRVSMNIARAFPNAHTVGADVHDGSVAKANEAARAAGLGDRVSFVQGSAPEVPAEPRFDLITCCDVVHDMADPLPVLRAVKERLAPGGTFLVMEPKVSDKLEENVNPVATMFYGFSMFHCMTQSLARGGAGLGACMGPAELEALAREAGFTHFEKLPIRSKVNLFFELKA